MTENEAIHSSRESSIIQKESDRLLEQLTYHEKMVLSLLLRNRSHRIAARHMNRTEREVNIFFRNAQQKLGTKGHEATMEKWQAICKDRTLE